ncbi:hypothetical protein [Photobacterium carnosum]|uniref:hypothetical protein n=1 Tax=Photobacterium carnosum TaxID=2023717 RepID=UPI001E2D299C|nr:hypothetical protein [Photobacterium carnosum]MCD9499192.1 hypothetical protein [Photobacterium carnosum]
MRKKRLFIPNLPQLIKVQSHNDILIFNEIDNRIEFCKLMSELIEKYNVSIYGFSFSDSECYFILYSEDLESSSRYIQLLLKSYTLFFNKKYKRTGTLWSGRYHNMPFELNTYLLIVLAYIEKKVSHDETYRSSYLYHIDKDINPLICSILNKNFTKKRLDEKKHILLNYNLVLQINHSHFFREKIEPYINQNCLLSTIKNLKIHEDNEKKKLKFHPVGRPKNHIFKFNEKENILNFERECGVFFNNYGYKKLNLQFFNNQGELSKDGTSSIISSAKNLFIDNEYYFKGWYQYEFFSNESNILEEHYECGSEIIGKSSIADEVEQIALYWKILSKFGISSYVHLHINNIGDSKTLPCYREALRQYFLPYKLLLNDNELKILELTPEILLLKHSSTLFDVVKLAPRILKFISNESYAKFEKFQFLLNKFNIPFIFDKNLKSTKHQKNINYNNNVFCFYSGDDILCCGGNYSINNINAFGGSLKTEKILSLSNAVSINKDPLSITVVSFSHNHYKSIELCTELRKRYNTLIVKHHPVKKRKKTESFLREIKDRFIWFIDEKEDKYFLYDSEKKEYFDKDIYLYISQQISC